MRLRSRSLREGGVSDEVAKSLPVELKDQYTRSRCNGKWRHSPYVPVVSSEGLPFGLILLKNFPLGVIANVLNVNETAQVELFRSKLRHAGY